MFFRDAPGGIFGFSDDGDVGYSARSRRWLIRVISGQVLIFYISPARRRPEGPHRSSIRQETKPLSYQ
jgi:hypothetical protein